MVIKIADYDCSLHCAIIGLCMLHTTDNIAPTHQRSCLHLSLIPKPPRPLCLSLPISFLPLYLSTYLFPPPSLHCSLPHSTIHSLPPSLPFTPFSPLRLSPPTSLFLFQACEWWWNLSSRTTWNKLSECWNFRIFPTPLWLDRMPTQTHISPCSTIWCTLFAPRCYTALCSVWERIC